VIYYFVDNDIGLKLAEVNLLDEVCSMFALTAANTSRLASLKFIAPKKLAKQGLLPNVRAQISKRIVRFCDLYTANEDPVDSDILNQLSSPKINPGEAMLLARTVINPDAVFLTGDKRCVIALVSEPNFLPLARRLAGRVEILESVVLRLVDRLGFDIVRDRVINAPPADRMLDIAFRTEESDVQAHATQALLSAEDEIERQFPGFLRRR
jgi:hypothetical protein